MEDYPSISSTPILGAHIYAFNKIDGSQIRAEWTSKRGFYKVGSRKRLIGVDTLFDRTWYLLGGTYQDVIGQVFRAQQWDRVVCFFELAGPGSFAGSHIRGETLDLTLLDVSPYGQEGLIPPKEFIKLFEGAVGTPELVYRGEATEEFLESVRSSTELHEGVVCKGRKGLMFKIKTRAWVSRVKALYAGDPDKLKELL